MNYCYYVMANTECNNYSDCGLIPRAKNVKYIISTYYFKKKKLYLLKAFRIKL